MMVKRVKIRNSGENPIPFSMKEIELQFDVSFTPNFAVETIGFHIPKPSSRLPRLFCEAVEKVVSKNYCNSRECFNLMNITSVFPSLKIKIVSLYTYCACAKQNAICSVDYIEHTCMCTCIIRVTTCATSLTRTSTTSMSDEGTSKEEKIAMEAV